jgi:serine/threonine protein kinase
VHAQGLAHGDLSLENVLLDAQGSNVVLIDFGASTGPRAVGVRGKPSYQAPEMHTGGEYDAFRADAFALGVLVFTLVVGDYPWQSTRHQLCSKFKFFTKKGMADYLSRRKVQRETGEIITLAELLSPEIIALLDGLLQIDPLTRLDVNSALQSIWLLSDDSSPTAEFSSTLAPPLPSSSEAAAGKGMGTATDATVKKRKEKGNGYAQQDE